MRRAAALLLALCSITGARAAPARFLGPEDFPATGCVGRAEAVLVSLGGFRLRIPFGDLKRLRTVAEHPETMGCDRPIEAEDVLVSTPDGFRGHLTYRAAAIRPEDAARILETLRGFAGRSSCEERAGVRICRVRPNPLAPVTTFVFARDPALSLASGAPAYLRCSPGGGAEVCKIQDLSPAGYQYEAAVTYTEDAATIAALHRIATTKWERFARAAAPAR